MRGSSSCSSRARGRGRGSAEHPNDAPIHHPRVGYSFRHSGSSRTECRPLGPSERSATPPSLVDRHRPQAPPQQGTPLRPPERITCRAPSAGDLSARRPRTDPPRRRRRSRIRARRRGLGARHALDHRPQAPGDDGRWLACAAASPPSVQDRPRHAQERACRASGRCGRRGSAARRPDPPAPAAVGRTRRSRDAAARTPCRSR